jgi:hypothetical protein
MFTLVALVVGAAAFEASLRAGRNRFAVLGLVAVALVFSLFKLNTHSILVVNHL